MSIRVHGIDMNPSRTDIITKRAQNTCATGGGDHIGLAKKLPTSGVTTTLGDQRGRDHTGWQESVRASGVTTTLGAYLIL